MLLSTVLSIQIAQDMDADQLGLLASFFSTLSSSLALIALRRSDLLSGNQQPLLGGLSSPTDLSAQARGG